MAAPQALVAAFDQTLAYFNARTMGLPDGLFDRKAQFVLNGAPFETLLSPTPNDPVVLMLSRGAAGYRFTAKALQYAVPDMIVERGEIITDGDPFRIWTKVWMSGHLRGTGEALNALVTVTLHLTQSTAIAVAEATVDAKDVQKSGTRDCVPPRRRRRRWIPTARPRGQSLSPGGRRGFPPFH